MGNKNFVIRLNSLDKVEALLQETYDLCNNQINQIQGEINKIANSTPLKDMDIDSKEKYGKIMNNYLTTIQKAIDRKFEIAKFMGDIAKHNGDIDKALNENEKNKKTTLDLNAIRQTLQNINNEVDDKQSYQIKNYKG
jgi:hypothetical protein